MRCNWIDILKNGDPNYNKNLSLTKWNYSLRPLPGMTGKKRGRLRRYYAGSISHYSQL